MFFGNSDLIAFLHSCIRSCSHLVPCVLLPLTINGNPAPRVQGEHQFASLQAPSAPAGSTIPLDTDSWLVSGMCSLLTQAKPRSRSSGDFNCSLFTLL